MITNAATAAHYPGPRTPGTKGWTMQRDWIEAKTDRMIRVAKSSQFAANIFRDARDFHAEGFVMDVALAKSLRYWVGNPVTGHTPGVDS